MLPLITTRGRPVLDWAGSQIAHAISEGWPAVLDEDALLLAQTLVRLAISYLTMPTSSPALATQEAVRMLAPFIERAVTASPDATSPGSHLGGAERSPAGMRH